MVFGKVIVHYGWNTKVNNFVFRTVSGIVLERKAEGDVSYVVV